MSYLVTDLVTEAVAFGSTVREGARRTESLATIYERGLVSAAYNCDDARIWDATDRLVDLIDGGASHFSRRLVSGEIEGLMGGGR